jgi:predicted nucleotidyltransferase component of viral defense system
MFNEKLYVSQVELLLHCLPAVASEECFAIKGGTAINLFIRDMPRLSVDIDLVYLPLKGRNETLVGIEAGLISIQGKLEKRDPNLKIITQMNQATQSIVKLSVFNRAVQIVIEPNLILRGLVYPGQKMDLAPSAETRFKAFVSGVPIASIHDVYAGKLCAALDRQHPRDLFDVKLLLEDGLTEEIKKAFLIYLASHSRPMAELLNPNRLDQQKAYQEEFVGMTNIEVSYGELIEARETLIVLINKVLTPDDKEFLLSIKRGKPNWDKIDLPNVDKLPGMQWKLLNISRMDKTKHRAALEKLERVLS